MHFFNISTSKSGPEAGCFYMLLPFWLWHVLRATTACTFSTSQLPRMGCFVRFAFNMCSCHSGVRFLTSQRPKVLWTWGVLCILFSKCASFWSLIRPDGSAPAALASLLFDPPETGEKHNVSRLFHLFAHLNPLSADSLSSDPFSSRTALATVAASVHKSEIWLLNFPR